MRALVHEVGEILTGSRVEKVYQPDSATVQVRLFPPRDAYLTLSASATRPYVVLLGDKLPVPAAPWRFCQLLRSRLEGGGIESIEQIGTDRVVRVVIRRRAVTAGTPRTPGDGDVTAGAPRTPGPPVDHRYELVAELFGPHADIYLSDLDEKRMLGRLKNGPMPERFADGYVAPEAPVRPSAFGMPAEALAPHVERAMGADGPGALFRELDAVPPGIAKLAVAIAREHGVPVAASALARHLDAVHAHAYAPVVIADGRAGHEVLLAPLEPLPAGWTATPYTSVTELARRVMVEDVRAGEQESRRAGVARMLKEMRTREEERLRHTTENLARCEQADQMEAFGNLLKGQLALVLPYRDSVEVQDWYNPEGGTVRIPLKKNLAPRANAERYFLKAKKLRASVDALQARLAEHQDNLLRVTELEEELARGPTREELEDLETQVRAIGKVSSGKARQKGASGGRGKEGPLEFVSTAGFRILVGRSSRENDLLTRKLAKPHDMWLHAKGLAGAHVLVRMKNKDEDCPSETIEEAAQLAAHYSKGRYSGKVEVLVTRAGTVRKPQGMAPGQVLVEGARSIMVKTDPQAAARLARPI